jgi:hypothetical protein
MMLLRKPRQLWPSGARFGLVLSLATSLIVMLAAQTPVEEKEESKPPKLRSDLPLLPPLESLQKIVVQPLGELLLEAERTSHPAVRDLLRRLAYPHDRVVLRNGSVLRVAPLARPLEQEKAAQLKLQVITPTGQLETQRAVARDEVLRVEYFERFAIQEVLQLGQETGAGKSPMKQSQVLRLAEFVLEQLLAFSRSGNTCGRLGRCSEAVCSSNSSKPGCNVWRLCSRRISGRKPPPGPIVSWKSTREMRKLSPSFVSWLKPPRNRQSPERITLRFGGFSTA